MKDVHTLLVPYFFIQLYYIIFEKALGNNQGWSWAVPIEANWYLLGLFLWRLFAPYFKQIRFPIITALLISLLIGFSDEFDGFLNLQRIIAFSPFFIVGYSSGSIIEHIKKNKEKSYLNIFAWLILAIAFIGFTGICYYSMKYGDFMFLMFVPYLGYNHWFAPYDNYGIIFRSMFFITASVISYFFLYIIPTRKLWFTGLGKNTLYVFLFNMFFLLILKKYFAYKEYISEFIAIPFSLIITIFLSNERVGKACNIILNPVNIFFAKKFNNPAHGEKSAGACGQ
jgi:fucose 4-O-acetylase-like acetyltransferase